MAIRNIASAKILYDAKHWSNSYYLAGYSIEMALKSVVSRQFSTDTIPDKSLLSKLYTHNFKELIGLAGLKTEYDIATKDDSIFGSNWAICSEWNPDCRYQDRGHAEAHYLLSAITDEDHGVLPWIKKYW
jgi:HEPN domain-containing protein